jgi:PAS domain-containing protein
MSKEKLKKGKTKTPHPESDYFKEFWAESWVYIKTVVDALSEPVLILDKDLKILAANDAFYQLFQVKKINTEGELIYKLGNGQWDIPKLRKLLEEILPEETFFKGFEVTHIFPSIGEKTIVLNAQHIYSSTPGKAELFPTLIMLAMDDITEMLSIASMFTKHTDQLEETLTARTNDLDQKISKLEKIIDALTKK